MLLSCVFTYFFFGIIDCQRDRDFLFCLASTGLMAGRFAALLGVDDVDGLETDLARVLAKALLRETGSLFL
jgi:hypothetical protein